MPCNVFGHFLLPFGMVIFESHKNYIPDVRHIFKITSVNKHIEVHHVLHAKRRTLYFLFK